MMRVPRASITPALTIATLCLVCAPAIAGAAPASARTGAAAPYVVVFKSSVHDAPALTSRLQRDSGFVPRFRYASALKGFAASLNAAQLEQISRDPAVSYVTPDVPVHASGMVSVAPGETEPVGIRRIGAASTTQVHAPSGVAVAVLDTGVDLSNADLNAVSAINCVKSGAAQDDNGHGTNVAGIIAARNQGGVVVGVTPGTKLYSVKVLGSNGSGTLSQLLCGINWVTANAAALNIRVANFSLTASGSNDNNCGNTRKDAEHQAICKETAAGVTAVAAAGNNSGSLGAFVPAAYPEVLTVTAMSDTDGSPGAAGPTPSCLKGQKDDSYATFSNYATSSADQAHVVAAPGTCVISDNKGGGTSTYYGTSQAAPHAAGAVALCIDDGGTTGPCAGLAPAQVLAKIRSDAATSATSANGFLGDPLRPVSGKYFGYLVNAAIY